MRVEGPLRMQHTIDLMDEFAHDGRDDDHLDLAGGAETGGEGLEGRVAAQGRQRREIERPSEAGRADLREGAAAADRGPGLANPRHQSRKRRELTGVGEAREVLQLAEE